MATDPSFGYGQEVPNDAGSDFAAIVFVVSQMTAKLDTAKLVRVVAVHGGGVAAGGTVDVLPLVQQIDGNGYGTPHGTVHGLPWSRVQGGKNAIIMDPVVGDVGYVVASDRDISKVKAQEPGFSTTTGFVPSTRRRFNIADGIYAGGCLNVAPEQYLIFTENGVRIVAKDGGLSFTDSFGNVISTGSGGITLTPCSGGQVFIGGKAFATHLHHVSTAPGTTGAPL